MRCSHDGIDHHSAMQLQAIDHSVARNIRARRIAAGLTQAGLAERIGLTYGQVHKYEAVIDRISAGRLHAIASALGCEVRDFYEDAPAIEADERLVLEFMKVATTLPQEQVRALSRLCRELAA